MEEELRTNYDVVILGTGFVESLLAAASARIGKSVLHIDRNNYYGGKWASFSLNNFEEWIANPLNPNTGCDSDKVKCGENVVKLEDPNVAYSKTKQSWHVSDRKAEVSEGEEEPWTKAALCDVSRKFNIDLAPKVLFSRGPLVELLISSNVARYVEFKCITRILTWMKENDEDGSEKLVVVPCSRSDVFTTEVVSLIEKRLLMKFLEFCHSFEKNEEQWEEYRNKTFNDFLETHKLTSKLIHFVTSAIAMVDKSVSCEEGLRKTALFLNSLGRYGTMPFLFSLYGSGEMPQAFCRLCAVFEGIYMLRSNVEGLVVGEDSAVEGVLTKDERFECKHIVMDASYAIPQLASVGTKKHISRAVFITDKSVFPTEKEQLTVMRMPSDTANPTPVIVYELGQATGVCPPKTYLVHLTCDGSDAEKDLKATKDRLFGPSSEQPNILYEAYFNQEVCCDLVKGDTFPSNMYLCPGPDSSLDYDSAIACAKDIFKKIFPDDDFLPRAPDPDEIVFDNEGVEPKEGDNFEKSQADED